MAVRKICYPAIANKIVDLGASKTRVADYLGISLSSLDNKLAGRYEFKFSEITKLSEWWGTSMESLAEGAYEIDDAQQAN